MSNRHPFALLACLLMLAAGNFTPVLAMTADTETESMKTPSNSKTLSNSPLKGEKADEFSEKEALPSRDEQVEATLKGTVVDENNEALIGAIVKIKGTTNGALCDINGNFVINDAPPGAVLAVSYIGYEPQEIPVNGRTSFRIKLHRHEEHSGSGRHGYGYPPKGEVADLCDAANQVGRVHEGAGGEHRQFLAGQGGGHHHYAKCWRCLENPVARSKVHPWLFVAPHRGGWCADVQRDSRSDFRPEVLHRNGSDGGS